MKKWKLKKKLNNKGFSLIELMIAIVILTTVSLVIMQGFLSAAKSNARAAKIQNATDLAQNVAEYYGAAELSSLLKDGSTHYQIQPKDSKLNTIYVFEQDDTSYGDPYHIITVLNPNKMEYQSVNGEDTPVLNHMYSNNSTYWMREFSRYDDDALKYIREQSGQPSVKAEDIQRKSKIDIHISNVAGDENGKIVLTYNLSVDYSATIQGQYVHKTYFPGYRKISLSTAQTEAPSMYLAYAPYDLKNIACSDELSINCLCDVDVNWQNGMVPVYLISQEEMASRKFTDANLKLFDNSVGHVMELHTNMQDVVNSGKGYTMTTGGSLEIVGNAAKNVIYQVDVYVLDRDDYDENGENWMISDDKSGISVLKYFTNFTTSAVK